MTLESLALIDSNDVMHENGFEIFIIISTGQRSERTEMLTVDYNWPQVMTSSNLHDCIVFFCIL